MTKKKNESGQVRRQVFVVQLLSIIDHRCQCYQLPPLFSVLCKVTQRFSFNFLCLTGVFSNLDTPAFKRSL